MQEIARADHCQTLHRPRYWNSAAAFTSVFQTPQSNGTPTSTQASATALHCPDDPWSDGPPALMGASLRTGRPRRNARRRNNIQSRGSLCNWASVRSLGDAALTRDIVL